MNETQTEDIVKVIKLCQQYKALHSELVERGKAIKPLLDKRDVVFEHEGEYFRLVPAFGSELLSIREVEMLKEVES